jgi:cyclic beta-1,2-glucan synthetase
MACVGGYLPLALATPSPVLSIPRTLFPRWFSLTRRRTPSGDDLRTGPIRGELLGAEHLADRARELARMQRSAPARRTRRPARLLARLGDTREILDHIHDRLTRAAGRGTEIGPAGEWLLDNYHVVREHVRQVLESLPRGYYQELPELTSGPLAGYPRVYELAITLISHTEARIDPGNVELFVSAFQERARLSIGELWAMPAMLRLGLIESVRRMALRTAQRLDQVEAAHTWVERILRERDLNPAQVERVLREFVDSHPPLTPIFVSRFVQQLRAAAGVFPPLIWIEGWFTEEGLSPDDAAASSSQRLALTKLVMANSIMSLRGIAMSDWQEFVERQSAMEHVLREDPSGHYATMTFGSRDAYRHAVERIAKRAHQDEVAVARMSVELARRGAAEPAAERAARRGHVGYWLIAEGVVELERAAGYRATPAEILRRWMLRHPNVVYLGGITMVALLTLGTLLWLAGDEARAAWVAVILLALIPASDVAVNLVNQILTAVLPPGVLPRLDLEVHGIPPDYHTAVVVPTLLDDVDAVEEILASLESQFLANRSPRLHFALLSDFPDSAAETRETDAAVLEAVAARVRALNARYAPDTSDAFYFFHRPRRWNPREGVWMGWERKRGKLAEFNRFLRSERADAFSLIVGDLGAIRQARCVITLDSDTVLPPGAAAALIGALAHPLNRPVYDAVRGAVVQGYGILQPRVVVSLASAHRSRLATILAGHPGVDPYTTAVSDVYQDLFGEGSFTGKGIYDVDAFERATRGRFPENRLLSHDLIEGNYARAGLATDITVYDDYPTRYLTWSRRKHRWIRGDWQLLQWLSRRVPGPDGAEPNRLSMLSRWKILDNLRRSLVEIAQLVFLVAGWTVLPGSPVRWTAIGLGIIAAPWLIALLRALVQVRVDGSGRAGWAAVAQDAATSLRQYLLAIVFLAHQAWLSADAIVRTVWRLLVSRRRLLQWQPASLAERLIRGEWPELWREMWPSVVLSVVALAVAIAWAATDQDPARLWLVGAVALPLAIVWAAAPTIAHALDRPAVPPIVTLSAGSRAVAKRYARLHWQYFEEFVTERTHWLAPDNFQEDPGPTLALRTSPTNIGLQLLATMSAHDLGFITREQMTLRLERAFATLDRLERYRGQFFNWYDLESLAVLEPAYVSTVDSGNLAGHLIALRQGLLTLAEDGVGEPQLGARLQGLAERAQHFALEMDFRFLYDERRELFAIGYHPDTSALDDAYYDLLASEARLASFVAIATERIDLDHWFRLGRTLTHAAGATALVSWSGSMFEYLMPALVMHAYPFTLLGESERAAVRRQIAYGAERRVPWGVSESAYNVRDRHFTYQYRAFGIPDLGLKRGLGRDLVVAPYASALALMIDPERALANLRTLEGKGALGPYGFRDALDYTRPAPNRRYGLVRNYMAHHIGMTLVALTNALLARVWQRRFHADPRVRAMALLLDERVPRRLVLQEAQAARPRDALPAAEFVRPVVREFGDVETEHPHVALLGHAPYTVMISHAGGGYSRYEEMDVSRWRADGTRDHTGQFCYVKDLARGRVWSAAHQPVAATADWYRALLATDRVTFHRADGDIDTRTEIVVVPTDAAEVRRVTVTNHGDTVREIELTSYGEAVLAPPGTDRAHPAFGKLFIQTEWHEWCCAITATRRPRSASEQRLWCAHVVATGPERVGPVTCETDRSRFLGRGRSTHDPIALDQDGPLSGTTGAVLDPVFALRARVRLAPGQSASVAFTTLVATTPERAFELADRYHDPHAAPRALDLAWTATQIEFGELGITAADATVFQELAGYLFYQSAAMRDPRDDVARCEGSVRLLWAQGISGDWPIVLATIDSVDGLPTLRQLFDAHRYWRRRGMTVDLVVLNRHRHGYLQELSERITELMIATGGGGLADRPGGIFIRRADTLHAEHLQMIAATARMNVPCDGRTLTRIHNDRRLPTEPAVDEEPALPLPRRAERSTPPSIALVRRFREQAAGLIGRSLDEMGWRVDERAVGRRSDERLPEERLTLDNGVGGLAEGGAYVVRVHGDRIPPAPWCNVIANEKGGFLVTERGAGFTWAANSYFFRLTPWRNDPVTDPISEVLYLRDEESGELWSATPAPVRRGAAYRVEHDAGLSTFTHERDGIATHLTLGLAPDEAVKISLLRITNRDERERRITVTAWMEWNLGVLREHTQHQVRTSFDAERGTIFARNCFDPEYSSWMAFATLGDEVHAHTGDRREFIGRHGTLADPAGLRNNSLGGRTGPAIDPCAALQSRVTLAPGEEREILVLLGAAPDGARARQLVDEFRDLERARGAVSESARAWRQRLSAITVRTPEPSFDAIVNRWSLYQALACRMWGRSALYQSSGAYGFRDQLQDVMAFVYAEPAVAREHLLRAASRQFVEGDVQHWWHPDTGRGVRTRFSDDLVWLPYVVDHYVRVTGDAGVLDESVPFLTMRQLESNEHEIYDLPQVTDAKASLYEHCRRALCRACTVGPHGLPLIGSGDWNDGMNRVGVEGRGESVWLAWFLVATLRPFADRAQSRDDLGTAVDFRRRADEYVAAVERHGWDGAWYRRAFFDDGTPLGSAENSECRIDSIAQSWSVISGAADPARQARAMAALEDHLVDTDARLIRLLTPPFDETPNDPGYIKGYLPGVRENGAQYTHAALWAVLATALRGDGDKAFEWFQLLNPLTHADTPEHVATYKVEPYVVAADVYTAPGNLGRGGWTWYTGSASWMYRVALEALLGFTKQGDRLRIAPCVPEAWPEFALEYRHGRSTYAILVRAPGRVRENGASISLDGRPLDGDAIPLVDDGKRHEVVIEGGALAVRHGANEPLPQDRG